MTTKTETEAVKLIQPQVEELALELHRRRKTKAVLDKAEKECKTALEEGLLPFREEFPEAKAFQFGQVEVKLFRWVHAQHTKKMCEWLVQQGVNPKLVEEGRKLAVTPHERLLVGLVEG